MRHWRLFCALLLGCSPNEGELAVEVYLDSAVSLTVESVSVHPADIDFAATWDELPLTNETIAEGEDQVELAAGPLEPGQYHHVFVDVTDIVSDGLSVEDIVEPIAAPFEMDRRSRRVVVDLITYELPSGELGLFAVDTHVD